MMRLAVHEERRYHTHGFLTNGRTTFGGRDQELMEVFESGMPLQCSLANVQFPGQLTRIPSDGLGGTDFNIVDDLALDHLYTLLTQRMLECCVHSGCGRQTEGHWQRGTERRQERFVLFWFVGEEKLSIVGFEELILERERLSLHSNARVWWSILRTMVRPTLLRIFLPHFCLELLQDRKTRRQTHNTKNLETIRDQAAELRTDNEIESKKEKSARSSAVWISLSLFSFKSY
mmetsp:Transcript_46111/g.116099  ORF Transcript_46111/g.116099 Transcript_46111/m.116099 type:complete len:232 (+) Transcript_46111:1860-2555(+)